jgi:hypothetical protein
MPIAVNSNLAEALDVVDHLAQVLFEVIAAREQPERTKNPGTQSPTG